ncbi:MAG: HlyC/CorC family transporter [Dehalococcoidales bacterium]|nr:HlyC/CorC family transporter [Dehalococcoidales bacterium]
MSTHDIIYLVILIICLCLSAFFSGSETAFISLQKYRIQHLVEKKTRGASTVARLLRRPERFLSTVLFGSNLVNTAASAIATVLAIKLWGTTTGTIVATAVITVLILIFADTTPKTIATRHSEKISLTLARPIEIISWIFIPFVIVLSWIARWFTKMVGGTPLRQSFISGEEIRTLISVGQREGTVEEAEAEMLNNVFDFGKSQIGDIIIPRTAVVSVEKGSKLSDFLKIYAAHPLTRYPVIQDNMDNVVGVLSIKDVLMAMATGKVTPESRVDDLLRPAYFAPETKPVDEVFAEMRDKNYHMVVVIDEFGGTAGVVSVSQLLEEIVGPFGEELTHAEKDFEAISENTFQVDGEMRIEDANKELSIDLAYGDYDTVAGFILHHLGHIPRVNEGLKYKSLRLVVTKMKGRKIEEIKLTKELAKEADATSTDKI